MSASAVAPSGIRSSWYSIVHNHHSNILAAHARRWLIVKVHSTRVYGKYNIDMCTLITVVLLLQSQSCSQNTLLLQIEHSADYIYTCHGAAHKLKAWIYITTWYTHPVDSYTSNLINLLFGYEIMMMYNL